MSSLIKNSKKAHEFIGLCLGVLADNRLVKAEVEFLRDWLRKHPRVASHYPVKGLFIRLCEMLEDEIIDEDEEKELFEHLYELTGSSEKKESSLDKLADKVMLPSFTDPVPSIKFSGSRFFLHGQFIIGTNEWLLTQVIDKGGLVDEELSDTTDYCIIGAMAEIETGVSGDLARNLSIFSEKRLKIISEENWVNLLFS
ncbi:MAG: hypothetical protein NE328_04495 [Lentisphaeraceae bacterium]|nr:hypothetical protein [Lentisphaeraceae bacterium]